MAVNKNTKRAYDDIIRNKKMIYDPSSYRFANDLIGKSSDEIKEIQDLLISKYGDGVLDWTDSRGNKHSGVDGQAGTRTMNLYEQYKRDEAEAEALEDAVLNRDPDDVFYYDPKKPLTSLYEGLAGYVPGSGDYVDRYVNNDYVMRGGTYEQDLDPNSNAKIRHISDDKLISQFGNGVENGRTGFYNTRTGMFQEKPSYKNGDTDYSYNAPSQEDIMAQQYESTPVVSPANTYAQQFQGDTTGEFVDPNIDILSGAGTPVDYYSHRGRDFFNNRRAKRQAQRDARTANLAQMQQKTAQMQAAIDKANAFNNANRIDYSSMIGIEPPQDFYL